MLELTLQYEWQGPKVENDGVNTLVGRECGLFEKRKVLPTESREQSKFPNFLLCKMGLCLPIDD